MKGKDYVHYMTLKEWKQWEDNVNTLSSSYSTCEALLNKEYDDFWSFVADGFQWGKAPEGHDYWSEISQRTKPLK